MTKPCEICGNPRGGRNKYCYSCKSRKTKFKLTSEELSKLLEITNCEICGNKLTNGKVGTGKVVDHCHNTGEIRGILCNMCNRGLGYFRDNIKSLANAIKYLSDKL